MSVSWPNAILPVLYRNNERNKKNILHFWNVTDPNTGGRSIGSFSVDTSCFISPVLILRGLST